MNTRCAIWAAFSIVLSCISGVALGQTVVRIEEDWSLQVIEPDQQLDSPQITTAILPLGPSSSVLFHVDFNHGSHPNYSAGGIQLRIDQNENNTCSKRLLAGVKLSRNAETIQWTQVITGHEGRLAFGIVNGTGQSWGSFGGPDSFITADVGTIALDHYRPTDSLENSGAVYAGNRVSALTLLRIRLFTNTGQTIEVPINQRAL